MTNANESKDLINYYYVESKHDGHWHWSVNQYNRISGTVRLMSNLKFDNKDNRN